MKVLYDDDAIYLGLRMNDSTKPTPLLTRRDSDLKARTSFLNGVILVSPAINMAMLPFDVTGNDMPYFTLLPAQAATAHFHSRLSDTWPRRESLLKEVEAFAGGEYLTRHSGIDPKRLTIKDYEGGHMLYLHQPSLEALSNDLVSFIEGK